MEFGLARVWLVSKSDQISLPEEELSATEMQGRVLHSLLLPVVSVAASSGVDLKDLGQRLQVAYLQYLRGQGMTHKEAAQVLGISERSAKRLQGELRTHFLRPEQEHNLPVRLEFILRASPMSRARLAQVLRDVSSDDLDLALERLLDEERIAEVPGRTPTYKVVRSVQSLVRDTWLARIGGFNSLLQNLSDTVVGRFLLRDERSFARTMSFHILAERYEELHKAFDVLVEKIAALDAEAEGNTEAIPVRLSVFFAPFGLLRKAKPSQEPPPKP